MKRLFLLDDESYEKIRNLLGDDTELAPVDDATTRECIENILFEMGVPNNTSGYRCLVIAIELTMTEGGAITKTIYPEVAKRVKASVINVERNIRFTLDRTWDKGLSIAYFKYFQRPYERPPNSVFISTVVHIVRERFEKESFGT